MDASLGSTIRGENMMNCVITTREYPYRPLKPEAEEIRLVVVEPAANASEPIICRLIHVSLNELPPYTALSYTWGLGSPCYSIVIDGYLVPVRENLGNAVRQLRQNAADGVFSIWIDAICINQYDNAEKSEQISKMRLIFERARIVAVWIGAGTLNSPLAFKLIRDLTCCPRETLSALITDPTRAEQIEALRQLYYREYWWRIWAVQEVVVARNATIHCGEESIPWTILDAISDILALVKGDLSQMLYHNPDSVYKLLSSGPRSMKLPMLSATDQAPLLDLLRSHMSKYSSDSRDKVYGLIGISDARDTFKIDYGWSTHAVYVYTAQHIIQTTNNLNVICVRVHDRNQYGLPSWVPDWARSDAHTEHRVMGLYIRTPAFRAAGETLAITEFSKDSLVLSAKGIMIGTIQTVGIAVDLNKVLTQPAMGESIPKLRVACHAFQQWWRIFRTFRGDDIFEQDIFERTIFGGSWSPAYELHQPHRLQLFSSLSQALILDLTENAANLPSKTKFAAIGDIDNEKNQKAMVSAASLRMHGKRLVISESRHVGLAPWNSAEGDVISVLLGCSFPVILRPANGYHLLIGEVYIDDLMNGEATTLLQEGLYDLKTFKLR